MSKEFQSRLSPWISMFHPTAAAQHRKDSDNGNSKSNPSNVVYERTERVMYDYENPTSNRFGTVKASKVVAEAPYERGHQHHHHNQYHRHHNVATVKTDKPYHSIHPSPTAQLPEFQTDFGVFGKTVRRSLNDEADDPYFTGHDINDLYDRPHDQKLKYPYTKCFITPDDHQDYCREIADKHAFEHAKYMHRKLSSDEGQSKNSHGKLNSDEGNSKNMNGKQNPEEGHSILHKYSSKGHEDKHFPDSYKEKDPDFIVHSKPYAATEGKVCANNICVTQHPKESRNEHVCHENVVDECKLTTKTKHVFPFKETPSGHLLIDPKLVAFENHKLSVLVANPNKTKLNININNNDAGEIHAITDSGRLKGTNANTQKFDNSQSHTPTINQDPEEVRNFLLKINQGSTKKDLSPAEDPVGHRLVESLSLDNQYSTASRGTEAYMENLHDRLKKAINPDTYVLIGQKSFPCHAVALEVCSPFFENIQRPRPNIHKIELPEKMVSPQIFPNIMEWMLQTEEGRKSIIAKDNVIAIYTAAVYLDMQELQNQCLDFVHTSIHPGDPLLMLMWDEIKAKPRCQEMMVALASKAASLFPDLYKTKKFLKLEIDELTMLLSSDEVVINNEMQIFDAAIRWLLFDWFNRKVYIPTVMGSVRFGLMTPLNLTQISHCPDTFRERSSKEYNQILTHPEVKALRDVGLAYAILLESYENRPEELNKWLEASKITRPRPRLNTTKTKAKSSPSQPITTLKAKDEKAKTAMSEDKVKHPPREESRKHHEKSRNADKHIRENDERKLSGDTPNRLQEENTKSNWGKVQSPPLSPSNSQEKLSKKEAPNFSSNDRMAGTFISPETHSGQPETSSKDVFSPGYSSAAIILKSNEEATPPLKNCEKQMNLGANNSNPVTSNSTKKGASNFNQTYPAAPYPNQSQPVMPFPHQTSSGPTKPTLDNTTTTYQNNPGQSKRSPSTAPKLNPSQPIESYANPDQLLSTAPASLVQNQPMTPAPVAPVQKQPMAPTTPIPNQPMAPGPIPNLSQPMMPQSNPESVDTKGKNPKSKKQTPINKSNSKTKSKLTQPKFFSKSKNPGDKQPGPGSKNPDDSGADT